MPRILRIINRFNLGGPTYNASYLTGHLSDYETLLVGGPHEPGESGSYFIPESMGVDFRILENMRRNLNPLADRKGYQEIRKIIREFKPDLVHTHASKAGALGRLAAKHEKVPVIVHTFHGHVFNGYFGKLKTDVYIKTERYLAKSTTGIIAISPIQQIELAERYRIAPSSKFKVIPLGFDLDKFMSQQEIKRKTWRAKHRVDSSTICVGIIGRLVPIKNHEAFLRIASMIQKEDVRFFIIGDGGEKECLEQKAQELGLLGSDPKITFTSWEYDIDISLAGLDIIALTSLNEGTPVSLIEAMAAGKPVVSTNAGGVPDIVQHGESGYILEQGDLDGFASKLSELIENSDLRNQMGRVGRLYATQNHGLSRLIHETDAYYQLLLSS